MSKFPVKSLYEYCEKMLRERWGYIYGTSGEMWSAEKQAKYKSKYAGDKNREQSCKNGGKWAGHMVTDCSGVMVYIWRQHGLKIAHGSNSIRRQYVGDLKTKPQPGYAAFKVRNGTDYHHIGIVAEDGLNVYEAKGTQAGFVMSAASSWPYFAAFKDVDYDGQQQGGDQSVEQYLAIVTTQKDPLNVREKPNTDSKIIFRVKKGNTLWVMENLGNGWARVEDDGVQGYASLQYLKKASESVSDASGDADGETQGGGSTEAPASSEGSQTTCYAVVVQCGSKEEAEEYAARFKNAIIVRYEKPPDAKGE